MQDFDDKDNNLSKDAIINVFHIIKEQNPNMSLDELLFAVYNKIKTRPDELFETLRPMILKANGINELEYYTHNVDEGLKKYVGENIFPNYERNDKGHGLIHIREVIRRAFALNATLKMGLEANMIYAIASYHDLGKYINSDIHEKIAADIFSKDEKMKQFFHTEERKVIKEAIQDHRSSKEDIPRSDYGKLISSADRNTSIQMVFIRSFFVAQERTPNMKIEEYLNFTFERLSKRYSKENPENMFFEDETYRVFLKEMRKLLEQELEFKRMYCEVNHIKSRNHRVCEEQGEITYLRNDLTK